MDFHFIDSSKISITNYGYKDFDSLTAQFGYKQETNVQLHLYFEWNNSEHWSLNHNLYGESELSALFAQSVPYKENVSFLIRLHHHQPLIKVQSIDLLNILDDLQDEVSHMGWEAISIDGKYIFEFSDSYQHKLISNFKIP
jgi:hypothetical protein